jgi:hypothetical protein
VLGLELKVVRHFAQEHFTQFDPIGTIPGQHQRFKVTSSTLLIFIVKQRTRKNNEAQM